MRFCIDDSFRSPAVPAFDFGALKFGQRKTVGGVHKSEARSPSAAMAEGDAPFLETFDATRARISQSAIASRLAAGAKDSAGRFRIVPGTSALSTPAGAPSPGDLATAGVRLHDPTKAVSLNAPKRSADARRHDPPDAARYLGTSDRDAKRRKGDGSVADASSSPTPSSARWATPGLVVKLMDKRLAARLYRAKAVTLAERSDDGASVRVRVLRPVRPREDDDGAEDEEEDEKVFARESKLKTVLPAAGKPVRMVAGEHAGRVGEMRRVHQARFLAEVALDAADGIRQRVEFLQYEEVCKIFEG